MQSDFAAIHSGLRIYCTDHNKYTVAGKNPLPEAILHGFLHVTVNRGTVKLDRYLRLEREMGSMWTSAELKIRAKGAFYKNYWHCVLTALVMSIFAGVVSLDIKKYIHVNDFYMYSDTLIGNIGYFVMRSLDRLLGVGIILAMLGILFKFIKVFIGNPLYVGGCRFYIMNQTANPTAAELGFGMQSRGYSNVVLTMFLKNLYIFLWSLLLAIPGIIKHYEYLMIPYILAENPEMDRQEAFLISKRMMEGQKMNAFVLDLSFIGWEILSAITGGIVGVFFVEPYYRATIAELYSVNRTLAYQDGYIR